MTDVTTTQTKSVSSCRRCKNPACTCSSTTNCLSCITDVKFFYSGGDCLACPLANCIKCKDAKTCDTCEENYGVNDVGACAVLLYCFKPVWSTDKKAMICDASNCYNGYFLNTDLKCAPCFTTSTETDVARAEGRCNTNTVASPVSLLTQCA